MSAPPRVRLFDPVNRHHPLNRNRTSWVIALPGLDGGSRFYDILGQNHLTLTGMTSSGGWRGTTRPGGFGAISCSTSQYLEGTTPVDNLLGLGTGTIALWQRKTDATLRASSAFGTSVVTDTTRINVHLPYSDGTIYFDWAGFTNNTDRLEVPGLTWDTNWHFWVFTVGAVGGMRCYRDGVLVGSNSATPARTSDSTNILRINDFQAHGISGDVAEYDGMSTWNVEWTAADVASYYALSRLGYPGLLNYELPQLMAPTGGASPVAVASSIPALSSLTAAITVTAASPVGVIASLPASSGLTATISVAGTASPVSVASVIPATFTLSPTITVSTPSPVSVAAPITGTSTWTASITISGAVSPVGVASSFACASALLAAVTVTSPSPVSVAAAIPALSSFHARITVPGSGSVPRTFGFDCGTIGTYTAEAPAPIGAGYDTGCGSIGP